MPEIITREELGVLVPLYDQHIAELANGTPPSNKPIETLWRRLDGFTDLDVTDSKAVHRELRTLKGILSVYNAIDVTTLEIHGPVPEDHNPIEHVKVFAPGHYYWGGFPHKVKRTRRSPQK